jgi:hypothetical protein
MVALGAVACDDAGTAPDLVDEAALRADVALVAADGVFEDLSVMLAPVALSQAGTGPDLVSYGGQGSYTFSKEVTFFAEDGTVQDNYDTLLTASINVIWAFERTSEHSFWSAEIERNRDMTITGLLGEETVRTWNGDADADVYRSRHKDEATRTYDMEMEATHSDVVRGVPRADNPWPLSGTITRHVHVIVMEGDEVIGERDVTATVTFTGTQFVTMNVDGDEFEIDLAERGVKKKMMRKGG